MKKINLIQYFLLLIIINIAYGGCGGCQINNKVKPSVETSAFINEKPKSTKIDGFVIASCSRCNLGNSKNKKCSMAIKIDKNVYEVKGHSHDHRKAHNHDGICNALRIAHVSGNINGNNFIAQSFSLMDRPK